MTTDGVPPGRSAPFPGWLTPASLVGLLLGGALGIAGNAAGWDAVRSLADVFDPVGEAWMLALRVAVVPLVVVQTLVAVLGAAEGDGPARLAARSIGWFVGLLLVSAAATLLLGPPLAALYTPSPDVVEALREQVGMEVPGAAGGAAGGAWAIVLDVLTGRHILPVLLVTLAAGSLLLRLPPEPRARLTRATRRLSDAVLRVVAFILLATPVAVFAILLGMGLEAGVGVAGVVGAFVVTMSLALLAATVAYYPLVALASRVPVRDFAKAAAPAQFVAVSTRSSIASLPALLEAAEEELEMPAPLAGLVLPLAVALFKANRTVSAPFQLVFLAHVFAVPLGPAELAAFVATVFILSFGSVGVPGGGGGMRSLPAYVAAGIPVQGYLLANASETIPDVFKTLLNVTADLAVACLVWRPAGWLGGGPEDANTPSEAEVSGEGPGARP